MNLPNYKIEYISEQQYLEDEQNRDIKHEYFDGEVYAMSGGTMNHQRLITALSAKLHWHLNGTLCEVFSSDMKVRADKGNKYFYPDLIVACVNDNSGNSQFIETPKIIIEVLSKSTRRFDRTSKRLVYQNIPTLEEYVLIEQERIEIEVCRKSEGWKSTFYYLGDDLTFTSIDLTLPVLEIYQRVENEEMQAFLAQQTDNIVE